MRIFSTVVLVSLVVVSLQGQSWAQYEPLNEQTRHVLGEWVGYDSNGDLYQISNAENEDGSVTGGTTITEVTTSGFRNTVPRRKANDTWNVSTKATTPTAAAVP